MIALTIPAIDDELVRKADALATGATIHLIKVEISIYRSSLARALRLLRLGDVETSKESVDKSEEYRLILQRRIKEAQALRVRKFA